jgi:hypothetical protein
MLWSLGATVGGAKPKLIRLGKEGGHHQKGSRHLATLTVALVLKRAKIGVKLLTIHDAVNFLILDRRPHRVFQFVHWQLCPTQWRRRGNIVLHIPSFQWL